MRIRLKKGVTLLGAIAGAAIATALIIYNVNHGNSVNVSDMEDSGLLNGLAEDVEGVLGGSTTPVMIADSDSDTAAVSAGVVGDTIADDVQDKEDKTVETDLSVTENPSDENKEFERTYSEDEQDKAIDSESPVAGQADQVDDSEDSVVYDSARDEIQTYVEIVPLTHTETVADEKVVEVEVPVSVVEEFTETVEADPVYFYSETGAAAAGEIATNRRTQEALAAKQADMERLETAAKEYEENASDGDWNVPASDFYDDSFTIFN